MEPRSLGPRPWYECPRATRLHIRTLTGRRGTAPSGGTKATSTSPAPCGSVGPRCADGCRRRSRGRPGRGGSWGWALSRGTTGVSQGERSVCRRRRLVGAGPGGGPRQGPVSVASRAPERAPRGRPTLRGTRRFAAADTRLPPSRGTRLPRAEETAKRRTQREREGGRGLTDDAPPFTRPGRARAWDACVVCVCVLVCVWARERGWAVSR